MSYQHPPRAQKCANSVFSADANKWLDDTNVLSSSMVDTTVQGATGQTETFLNTRIAQCNDDIETCTQNIREYNHQLPNASPSAREQLLSYINRDFQTRKEAMVRLMIFKRAIADIKMGRCKKKTTQGTNCDKANLSFVDYCEIHR